MELTVTATADHLRAAGYPICRQHLAVLTKAGHGPPFHYGPELFGKKSILIDSIAALSWAFKRSFRPAMIESVKSADLVDATVDVASIDKMLLFDHLIMYLRERYPQRWAVITRTLQGAERRQHLNDIALQVITLAETLFVNQEAPIDL